MNKKKLWKKLLAGLTAGIVAVSALSINVNVLAAESDGTSNTDNLLINSFLNPDDTSGLMARYWFPDAGAGYDSDGDGRGDYIYMVEDMINEFIEAGFGGVELTMLADNADYYDVGGSELASKIGWGTEAWSNIIAAAVDTANQYKEKTGQEFIVDVTITAHWPMIINTIDPNDDNQQQELSYTYQKLTAVDLGLTRAARNDVYLDLPAMKTKDESNTDTNRSTFIFTDKLVSTVAAKVASVDQKGNPVLDYDSIVNLTDYAKKTEAYSAGIPNPDWTFMKLVDDGDGYYEWEYYTAEQAQAQLGVKLLTEPVALDPNDPGRYLDDATITVKKSTFSSTVTIIYADGTTTSFETGGPAGNQGIGETWFPANTAVTVTEKDGKTYYSTEGVDPNLILVVNADYFGEKRIAETGIMADTQYEYYVNGNKMKEALGEEVLAGLDSDDNIEAGDYVLVNTYRRGTGQVASGGENITMEGKTYAIDYFNSDGANEVLRYWNENILPHVYTREDGSTTTVQAALEENGGTIFEDSIELSHTGQLWSKNLLDNFASYNGYSIAPYASLIAGLSCNDTTAANRINEDYSQTLSYQYTHEHNAVISDWAKGFGYSYRAQGHGLSAVDAGDSALAADIPESDNGSDGNGTRTIAGAVNLNPDQHYMSMEALTFGTGFSETPAWYYCLNTLNRYYSEGVNRVILHGTPFKKSYTDYDKQWPGWTFMSFMAWNSRQTWWDDVDIFTDYIARVQGILQDGTAKIPVAILKDAANSNLSASELMSNEQDMVGKGYTYNILTKGMIESEYAATTTNEDGKTVLSSEAEYQVLILDNISKMSVEAMQKIVDFAKAGLTIVDNNGNINAVYGTSYNGEDETIQSLYAELQQQPSYVKVSSDDEALAYIEENIDSGVSYDAKWLESTRFDDVDGSKYYLMYNESDESASSEHGGGPGEEAGDISTMVTLKGNGAPYKLDPATGEVTAITNYTSNNGTVSFQLDIEEGNLFYIVVSDNEAIAAQAIIPEETTEQTTIELGGENTWNLDLQSWGPLTEGNTDEDGNLIDPTLSEKIDLNGLTTTLVNWKDLSLTEEQLNTLGVSKASDISGIGNYS